MKKAIFLRLAMALALLLTVNINVMGDTLRKGGSIVGKIESNGDVRKSGSVIGKAEQMTNPRRIAVMYFFDFFKM